VGTLNGYREAMRVLGEVRSSNLRFEVAAGIK